MTEASIPHTGASAPFIVPIFTVGGFSQVRGARSDTTNCAPHDSLTNSEAAVYVALAWGMERAAIAKQLFVSPSLVSHLRACVLRKLGVRNVRDVVRYALRHRGVNA